MAKIEVLLISPARMHRKAKCGLVHETAGVRPSCVGTHVDILLQSSVDLAAALWSRWLAGGLHSVPPASGFLFEKNELNPHGWPTDPSAGRDRRPSGGAKLSNFLVACSQTGNENDTNCRVKRYTRAAPEKRRRYRHDTTDAQEAREVDAVTIEILSRSDQPIRIGGWGVAHGKELNEYRQTLWEIHPLEFRCSKAGRWVDVDKR